MTTRNEAALAEVLCAEKCAQAGDPPCSRVSDDPHCDECIGMAKAVLGKAGDVVTTRNEALEEAAKVADRVSIKASMGQSEYAQGKMTAADTISYEIRARKTDEPQDDGLVAELKDLADKAFREAPAPWETDTEQSEGEYGSGPNTFSGFDVSLLIDANGRSLFDALNSTAIIVHEDGPDEDGYVHAWDDVSAANAALIVALVNNLPRILAALRGGSDE